MICLYPDPPQILPPKRSLGSSFASTLLPLSLLQFFHAYFASFASLLNVLSLSNEGEALSPHPPLASSRLRANLFPFIIHNSYFIIFPLLLLLTTAQAADETPAFTDLMKKGDSFDAQLKTREALALYLEAEKLQPADARLLADISKQYAESMDDTDSKSQKLAFGDKGIAYAKRAIAADPDYALGHLSLAVCYGRNAMLLDSKTKLAYSKLVKEHAEKALALDPKNDLAYHVLGVWNYQFANLNPILRTFAKWIYGDIPAASNEEALEYFRKAIALNPRRAGNWIEMGRTYAAMGDKVKARETLNKGLAMPVRQRDDAFEKKAAREALASL